MTWCPGGEEQKRGNGKSKKRANRLGFVVHSFRPAEGVEGSRLIRQRRGGTDSCLHALEGFAQRHHLPQSHVEDESG